MKPLEPKLSKFNPISGFKRIFSKQSIVNLLFAIAKILLVFYIAYTSIKGQATFYQYFLNPSGRTDVSSCGKPLKILSAVKRSDIPKLLPLQSKVDTFSLASKLYKP